MRCHEIMKTNVEWIRRTDSIVSAARKMRAARVGFLPVCDEAGRVVGILTDRDIAIRHVADERPPTTMVEEIMSRGVVSCRSDEALDHAEELMGRRQKSRIVVVDEDEKLIGVISLSDIAQIDDEHHAAQTLRLVTEREARV